MPKPFLLEAVQRELPNMTIVRSLVEDFHVDVTERTWGHDYTEGGRQLEYDQSALHHVAEGLHWWHVHLAMEYLLKVPGIDVNFRVKGGLAPLHVAVGGRTVVGKLRPHAYDAAERLLNAGADVQAVTRLGTGCLSLAVHDVRMIRLLIKHGAIISPDDVVSAIEAGEVDVLNELLSAKDTNVGEGLDLDLDPALRTAGMLFMKSNPDDQDDDWRPTVDDEIAIEMIKILLGHGANPLSNYIYCPEQEDDTPRPRWREHLHFKKDMPRTTCADTSHREVTLLHELIRGVRDFQIQPFLIPGLDVNHRDPQGHTILHVACGRVDLIAKPLDLPQDSATTGDDGGPEGQTLFQHLVALGADIHARDQLGQNILVSLIRPTSWSTPSARWRDTLEDILRLAPELVHDDADARGDTPLIHAVRVAVGPAANTETARRLLSAGASPLVTDSRGESVLHILAEDLGTAGLRDLFRDLVVNHGVDINGRSITGETPLFKFARRSPQDSPDDFCDPDYGKRKVRGDEYENPREQGVVALLQELGADFFARDNEGRGLLHIAAKGGDVVRFQELMAVGLDPMMEDNAQQTAIDAAAASSNNAVLEIFEKKARR
jgi:ankyrin repeat protein